MTGHFEFGRGNWNLEEVVCENCQLQFDLAAFVDEDSLVKVGEYIPEPVEPVAIESQERPKQFLQVVKDAASEGITIFEASQRMGMSGPNYLYRLAPQLVEEGLVHKVEKRYYLTEAS